MSVGMGEMIIAFSVLSQCTSSEKSRRKVLIYKFTNSSTVLGRIAFDNNYLILKLNYGLLSILLDNACVVIMVYGYMYEYIYS